VAAALAATLRIGTRGHKGEKDLRDIGLGASSAMEEDPSSTSTEGNREVAQRLQISPKQ
jgi:hypothetical protein